MGMIKLEKVGAEVNWPKCEKIPTSLEEALKLGWKVTGSEGNGPDEFHEAGVTHMHKTTGRHRLYLAVPYQASFEFGKPHTPKAHGFSYGFIDSKRLTLAAKAVRA